MSRSPYVLALILLALPACEEPPPPDAVADVARSPSGGDASPAPPGASPETAAPAAPADWTVLIDDAPIAVGVGELVILHARVVDAAGAPVDAPLRWTSSADTIAWASPTGEVLAISAGSARITAHAGAAASAPVTVEVAAARPAAPSYAAVVDPILRASCATAGCHVDGVEPGDLRFDRAVDRMWEELVDDAAEQTGGRRVAPGDPAGSYLIEKLVSPAPAVGGRMPLGRPPLTAAQLQVIVTWIAGGAPR